MEWQETKMHLSRKGKYLFRKYWWKNYKNYWKKIWRLTFAFFGTGINLPFNTLHLDWSQVPLWGGVSVAWEVNVSTVFKSAAPAHPTSDICFGHVYYTWPKQISLYIRLFKLLHKPQLWKGQIPEWNQTPVKICVNLWKFWHVHSDRGKRRD